MPDSTLLAHVVAQFASRRWEDVATEALHYLLKRPGTDRVVSALMEPAQVTLPAGLAWRTQALDADDPSRPDLVGNDRAQRHVVIVEAKFWAALTANQPRTYLERQDRQFGEALTPRALIFLCPARRLDSLAAELEQRMGSRSEQRGALTVIPHPGSRVVLLSWGRLLTALESSLGEIGDRAGLADLEQLRGLVDRADSEAMLPLGPDDVASEHGRRYVQFCDIVDAVTDRLKKEKLVDTKALKASATKSWYGRYVRSQSGHVFRIYVDSAGWGSRFPSPWWVRFWHAGEPLAQALKQLKQEGVLAHVEEDEAQTLRVALAPPLHVERERIIELLTEQVRRVCLVLPQAERPMVPRDAVEGGPEPED